MVNISGKIDRATILFKDFGINHFIDEPLSSIMAYGGGHFNSWSVDPLFTGFVEKLFNVDDNVEISLKLTTPFRFKLTTYSAGN